MAERHAAPGDMPLFRWGAELRRTRAARRRRRITLGIGAAGIAILLASVAAKPRPRLVWNVSESAPTGLYGVTPGAALKAGDLVAGYAPAPMRELAAQRRYLPRNVPLVKRVAALAGNRVCGVGESVFVDGRRVAARLAHDGRGRPMPWWTGCRRLGQGDYLLLMDDVPASFDGRYFGPVSADHIIGRAVPLWVG